MVVQELPHPGHFCGSTDCRFRRHTHVGDYCVSTVGDYWPAYARRERCGPETIGFCRTHETMVFRLVDAAAHSKCCPRCPGGGRELDMVPYNSDEAAQAGHESVVEAIRNGRTYPLDEDQEEE